MRRFAALSWHISPVSKPRSRFGAQRALSCSHSVPPRRRYSSDSGDGHWTKIEGNAIDFSLIEFPEEPYMRGPVEGPYGYFPMILGQTLDNGRYEIILKLGWGKYASVWLAKEKRGEGHRYRAIKVLNVNASYGELISGDMHEVALASAMLRMPKAEQVSHPGYPFCSKSLRVSTVNSIHGKHAYVVYHPYGSSLAEITDLFPDHRLALSVVRSIARQVLLALSFLHDKFHVVHTDVKASNILVYWKTNTEEIDRFLADNPAQTYPDGPIISHSRISPDPIVPPRSQPLPNFGLAPSLENLTIRLTDYGGAINVDKITPDTLVFTPDVLKAPEQLLGGPWSQPVDVWSVGCLIYSLLTGTDLSGPTATGSTYSTESHLAHISELLGPFPTEFVQRCEYGPQLISDGGLPFRAELTGSGDLEKRLRTLCPGLTDQEAYCL